MSTARRIEIFTKWVITLVAVGVLVARLIDANAFARVDIIGVGLLVIAILPWASSFVTEIKIAGLEAKLRTIEERADAASAQANNATQRAMAAEDLALKPGQHAVVVGDTAALEQLAADYVRIRKSMPSGDERTSRMTAIFRDMTGIAHSLGANWPDAVSWFTASDVGKNLAAIAHAYVFQEAADVSRLIACVASATQPFIQYWALRVILDAVKGGGLTAVSPQDIKALAELESHLPRGTDRGFLITAINALVQQRLR